jgi:oligosaccharide reducing-end xylanase
VKTSADFKSRTDTAASARGWCVYLIHGIDNDGGYSPIPSDTIRASLIYLKANPDKFWVTSFGNAAKYIFERNAASVSEILTTEDSIIVIASDTLDNLIYNRPITIRRPLPQNWSSAYVVQNGNTVASQIVEVNSTKYIMFDVIPDNGNITLIKNQTTGFKLQNIQTIPSSIELHQNYSNPFNPTTVIGY